MKNKSNPVMYFEIPVNDMDRAMTFYAAVFNVDFDKETIDVTTQVTYPRAI